MVLTMALIDPLTTALDERTRLIELIHAVLNASNLGDDVRYRLELRQVLRQAAETDRQLASRDERQA